MMQWLLLAFGIIMEVCATTCMKLSEGFSNLLPSVLTFIFWGISFTVFILALKSFDLSYAYAVWAGVGILTVSIIGILYFKEPVSALKIISIILIVMGVIGINLSDLVR
ncbi:MAG: multidrug efflux SMR transporter [Halobacteriota archaeon]|jgi:small multidrug resistance pump|uniref:Spermidine export protein MdtJ n=1 Tax=Candidatus Methanophaga sp. ANME-1 ERB7 TaxID=2759913 RepID=A0A7G9Z1Z9_9EURY|nr:spermidine export protein MdtJ [Methanosarcinales archaeon ANME-1 ERB7]